MIFTFYSYKGGVGRSMALANVAKWLSMQGLRVTMIDWDLEAPGLESFFFQGDQLEEVRDQLGLIDMLVSYRRLYPRIRETLRAAGGNDGDAQAALQRRISALESVLPPLESSLHALHEMGQSVGEGGALNLLSAGWRAGDKFAAYAQAVQEFDWDEFYLAYEGQAYFEWMRRQLLAPGCSDVVLIDSRTGVTEMGGVCTRQLADAVFTFSAPNLQNLEGIISMATSFIRDDLKAERGRQIDVVMVPTRVDNFNETRINHFMRGFEAASDRFTPAVFRTLKTRFWNLRIPYTPGYAYQERLAIGDSDSDKDLEESYKRVAAHLAMLAPPQTRLRRRLGAEIERVFGRLLPTVFVTYAHEDRAVGAGVRQRLADANISVWPDPSETLAAPGDWRQAVGGILEQTRFLVVIVSAASARSSWIRNVCRYARQLGVCVVPIAVGSPEHDVIAALPGWMRGQHISDINAEWPRVLSWVGGPNTSTRVPLMAPELPDGHVPRPEAMSRLSSLVFGGDVRRAAIVGLPGSGKSTLASEFCRGEDADTVFQDGIIWMRATDDADPKAEMQKALAALTGETVELADARDGRSQLERRLSGHRCLIVLDDAWSAEGLAMFPLEIPGCRYLVTTCDRAVALRAEAVPVEAGALTEAELAAMLRRPIETIGGDVGEFLRRLAVFPQALRIAAAALTNGQTLAETDPAAIADILLTHVGPRVVKAFRKEVLGRLSEDDRERLVLLTFASGDAAIARTELPSLWDTDQAIAARTLSRLEDLSAVEVDAHRVHVPPWVRYLVAACYPDRDVNKAMETAFGRLDAGQRETARQVFCRLVRLKETVNGASLEPQTVSTSVLTPAQAALLEPLAGMTMVKLGSGAMGPWVALADESASRQWRRLREWIRDDKEFLLWRQRLERYLGDWRRTSDEGALLSGALLDEANHWLASRRPELCADETAYIDRSGRGRPGTGSFAPVAMPAPVEAAKPASNWRMAGLAAAVLIVAVLGSTTFFLRSSAEPTTVPQARPDTHAEVLQADLLAERGDITGAVKAYTAVLAKAGDDATLYFKRGVAYARNPAEMEKALADFDRAVAIDPNRGDILGERANVRLQKGDIDGALEDFTGAIERDPRNADLFAQRAAAYEAAKKPELALRDYSKALELDTSISSAYFRRAGLYENDGQRERAIEDLRRVVQLNADPTSVRAAQARLERLGQPRATPTAPAIAVFLHFVDEHDRQVMGKVRAALVAAGYRVLGVQLVARARTSGDVRYVPQDLRMAANVATTVERALADVGYDVPMAPIPLNMPQARAGRVEVWIPSLSAPLIRQQGVKK